MTERDALLAATRESPDDDAPRLVYADWLIDHAASEEDHARAEFIRLGCELSRMDADDVGRETCARREALVKRIGEIEKQYKKPWTAELTGKKGPLRGRDCSVHLRRGFPDRVFAPTDRLIAEGDALFRLAPITEVDAKGVTADNLDRLLACGWLARVRRLTLAAMNSHDAPRPDWGALATCPHLGDLDYLWLSAGRLSRDGGERLAAADPFPRLRHLMISECNLTGDGGIDGLFGGPAFGRLQEAYFHRCGLGAAAAEVIARSAALAGIRKLSLPNQPLSAEAVRILVGGRYWPTLRGLVLWGCSLGDAEAAALTNARPSGLRALEMSMNDVGPAGVEVLAASRILEGLEVLNLTSNPVWDRGASALARSPHVGNLRRLHLGGCGIGEEGAKALAGCAALSGLLWLTLGNNAILKDGALAIADSPHLAGLTYLSVRNVRGKARERLKERFGDRVRL